MLDDLYDYLIGQGDPDLLNRVFRLGPPAACKPDRS